MANELRPIRAGNIDLVAQPRVRNADGSISTVRSMSFGEGGQEILVPTVAHDGSRILSDQEAIDQYRSSGKHLGMFSSPRDATAYAQQLHEDYERGKYDVYPGMEKLGALPGIPNPPPLPASPYWTPLSMLQRFSSQKRKTYGE